MSWGPGRRRYRTGATHNAECETSEKRKHANFIFPLMGLLGSSPLWSIQKFASGRVATPGSTSLNATFVGA
jgi:hypothetical protein